MEHCLLSTQNVLRMYQPNRCRKMYPLFILLPWLRWTECTECIHGEITGKEPLKGEDQ